MPRVAVVLTRIRQGYFDIWWIVVVASVPTPDILETPFHLALWLLTVALVSEASQH